MARVTSSRALGFPLGGQLDAAPGEANETPIFLQGGTFGTLPGFVTNTEISGYISGSNENNKKVYKSGAGTGVTRGKMSALLPVSARDDATGTLYFINQVMIVPDPDAASTPGGFSAMGDSGSLWIHASSGKVLGLTHTVGAAGAVVSRIEDVVNALQIQFA